MLDMHYDYSSLRPTDDHGARPFVLVIFREDLTATQFLRVAIEEMVRTRTSIPCWSPTGARRSGEGHWDGHGSPAEAASSRCAPWTKARPENRSHEALLQRRV